MVVELEAFTTGDQIDEHYMFVKGGFGTLKIGADPIPVWAANPGRCYDTHNGGTFSGTYGSVDTADYSNGTIGHLHHARHERRHPRFQLYP